MTGAGDEVADAALALRLVIGRLARHMRRLFTEEQAGLAFLELGVLDRLHRCGPTSPGELSEGEGVTGPAIAATLRHLEDVGLVARSRAPHDARRVVVAITEDGRRSLRRRDAAVLTRVDHALRHTLDDTEREHLLAAVPLLEKVAAGL